MQVYLFVQFTILVGFVFFFEVYIFGRKGQLGDKERGLEGIGTTLSAKIWKSSTLSALFPQKRAYNFRVNSAPNSFMCPNC